MNEDILADIRNKLTPFKNLVAMIEDGVKSNTVNVHHYIIEGMEDCKKSIEYLSNLKI